MWQPQNSNWSNRMGILVFKNFLPSRFSPTKRAGKFLIPPWTGAAILLRTNNKLGFLKRDSERIDDTWAFLVCRWNGAQCRLYFLLNSMKIGMPNYMCLRWFRRAQKLIYNWHVIATCSLVPSRPRRYISRDGEGQIENRTVCHRKNVADSVETIQIVVPHPAAKTPATG